MGDRHPGKGLWGHTERAPREEGSTYLPPKPEGSWGMATSDLRRNWPLCWWSCLQPLAWQQHSRFLQLRRTSFVPYFKAGYTPRPGVMRSKDGVSIHSWLLSKCFPSPNWKALSHSQIPGYPGTQIQSIDSRLWESYGVTIPTLQGLRGTLEVLRNFTVTN